MSDGKTYTPGNAPGTHEPLPKKSIDQLRKAADVGATDPE